MDDKLRDDQEATARLPEAPKAGAGAPEQSQAGTQEPRKGLASRKPSAAPDELDLTVERIETEGVMKEGFTGQEM